MNEEENEWRNEEPNEWLEWKLAAIIVMAAVVAVLGCAAIRIWA